MNYKEVNLLSPIFVLFVCLSLAFTSASNILPRVGTVSVPGTSFIQAATLRSSTLAAYLSTVGGITAPISIPIPAGSRKVLFNVTGQLQLCTNGCVQSNIDGLGQYSTFVQICNSGNDISGITSYGAGYLIGAFVSQNATHVDTGTGLPPSLNYMQGGISFKHHAPMMRTSFFIGDGLTGTGEGENQIFHIPNGASRVYFGITDCLTGSTMYGDNTGEYSVTYHFRK